MNKMRSTPKRYFWLIFTALLLTACNLRQLPATPAPTQTAAVQWTATPGPTALPQEAETPGSTPTPTPLSLVKVDGLRVAYILDGNLYVQDSGGQPLQLTQGGKDHHPIFSDDGKKIAFYRGAWNTMNTLYVIHADGSQEQALVTNSSLTALDPKYSQVSEVGACAFVPGAHQLLCNTQEFKADPENLADDDRLHSYSKRNADLLSVDTDTHEIKNIFPDAADELFYISPDGKLVTDFHSVFRTNGDLVQRNLIVQLPGWKNEYKDLSWTQDSSKLMVVAPIKGSGDSMGGPEPNTIWQYSVAGGPPVEIRLNPAPMSNDFALSPDGNWIAYTYFYYPGKTDEATPEGVYLGNLRDGATQLISKSQFSVSPWSSDNNHFMLEDPQHGRMYLGNIHGEITPVAGGRFLGWLDGSRYVYDQMAMGEIGKGYSMAAQLAAFIENPNPENLTFVFVKPK